MYTTIKVSNIISKISSPLEAATQLYIIKDNKRLVVYQPINRSVCNYDKSGACSSSCELLNVHFYPNVQIVKVNAEWR